MAASFHLNFFLCSLLFISSAVAQTSLRPKALVLPTSKDASTLQHLTQINQRTPLVPVSLTVDLGGPFLWVDCDQGYVSSTYRPTRCRSAPCSLANSNGCGDCFSAPRPGCNNNTCGVSPENTITKTATGGELASDVVSVQSTDGKNPRQNAAVSQFLFACGPNFLLEGLAGSAKGMAGLGRTRISLPSQFSASFSFDRKFALCLSSSTSAKGAMFFGDGPYHLSPDFDVSTALVYTPLLTNPSNSDEYFIGVRALRVSQNVIPINTTLLSINREGIGGTKISTVTPYTVVETSIFNAIADAFTQELSYNYIERVAPVAPFGACYNSKNITYDALGPYVPFIDFVLQRDTVIWSIVGANSMVRVRDDVMCLAFVDGGLNPRTSIVIGTYQFEDNLLQFDLATSRLGFSYSLLARQTNCSNFNFTSTHT